MPLLAGAAGEASDGAALSILLQQSLAVKKEEEERRQKVRGSLERLRAKVDAEHAALHGSSSSSAGNRKKRRKRRLPRTSSRPSWKLWRRLRFRVRVCRLLEQLLLWCHEFGFLLVFGVKVATFIWTCLSTLAGWRSTPLFPRWHWTCRKMWVFRSCGLSTSSSSNSLSWRRGGFPWSRKTIDISQVAGHGDRRSCCADRAASLFVHMSRCRAFPMVQTVCRTIEIPSCSSTR